MTDDLDRIMAVMEAAFDPAFGEAWTRRQVGDARVLPNTHYLLAGAADDITTPEQVFNAEHLVGTPRDQIHKELAPGGHIGLFMGAKTLKQQWARISRWIVEQG